MDLSKLNFKPRLRNSYDATDLGLRMTQEYLSSVYPIWCLWVVAFFILIQVFASSWEPGLRSLLFWWLIPLFEPLILHVVSRRVFGETIKFSSLVKQTPKIILKSGILWFCTLLRLSPKRSTLLPVFQLEGGSYAGKWTKRRSVIGSGKPSGTYLTFIYAHVEALLSIVFVTFYFWAVPEDWIHFEVIEDYGNGFNFSTGFYELYFYFYALSVLIARPIYVVSGFLFYLSRRIKLEAWDIELQFRQLANRVGQIILLGIFGLFCIPEIQAEDSNLNPKQRIDKILDSDEFSTEKEIELLFDFEQNKKEEKKEESRGSSFNAPPIELAQLIKFLSIALLIGLFVYILMQYMPSQSQASERVDRVIVSDVRAKPKVKQVFDEQEQDQLLALVEEYLAKGEQREAMAIIYNCSLKKLASQYRLRIPVDATEREVFRTFKKHIKDGAALAYFKNVMQTWVALAYGQAEIEDNQIRHFAKKYDQLKPVELVS